MAVISIDILSPSESNHNECEVVIQGALDSESAERAHANLYYHLTDNHHNYCLDFSGLQTIDLAGLNVLMKLAKMMMVSGRSLMMKTIHGSEVYQKLDQAKIHEIVELQVL